MPSRVDQIIDLLLDALLERQKAREGHGFQPTTTPVTPVAAVEPPPKPEPEEVSEASCKQTVLESPSPDVSLSPPTPITPVAAGEPPSKPESEEVPEASFKDEVAEVPLLDASLPPPAPVPTGQMGRTLFRLAVALLLLVVLVNVPIKRHNVSLARVLPDSTALVIRDGLLLKGQDTDEIYVMKDEMLRWISSLEAFEHYGYRWQDVHVVEQSFLEKFEKGWSVHVLLKCAGPHIYALENGQKRWIKDIPTFKSRGYVWDDVKFVSCQYLRSLPDGPPIPEDAGPPPQP